MSTAYKSVVEAIDAANAKDPRLEHENGAAVPKELLYGQRMAEMLQRFRPDADEVMKLAVRGQHIERWTSPRADYPEGRVGYLKWRKDLYRYHASRVVELMGEAGYDEGSIQRAKDAVGKRQIKQNPDSQLVEDVASLVFLEHYLATFAAEHPEYDEEKWIGILGKTWKKMSDEGRVFAQSGALSLPDFVGPLLAKVPTTD